MPDEMSDIDREFMERRDQEQRERRQARARVAFGVGVAAPCGECAEHQEYAAELEQQLAGMSALWRRTLNVLFTVRHGIEGPMTETTYDAILAADELLADFTPEEQPPETSPCPCGIDGCSPGDWRSVSSHEKWQRLLIERVGMKNAQTQADQWRTVADDLARTIRPWLDGGEPSIFDKADITEALDTYDEMVRNYPTT